MKTETLKADRAGDVAVYGGVPTHETKTLTIKVRRGAINLIAIFSDWLITHGRDNRARRTL